LVTEPGVELAVIDTSAAWPEPLYVTGELVTASVAVGVALFITKEPAERFVKVL
jgi:hypothetical protein